MKYLCLVYREEDKMNTLSQKEHSALVDESLAYDQELRSSGHLIAAQALEGVRTATTLRVRSGRLFTTDGPFAETKEQLGGFILVEAADLNEAMRVATKIPMARLGTIEVRPVRELVASDSQKSPGRATQTSV